MSTSLKVGDIVKIKYDKSKPNDHFLEYMKPYIGKYAIISKIYKELDYHGYHMVHVDWSNGNKCGLFWREYDFDLVVEPKDLINKKKFIFTLTDDDFKL